MKKYSVGPVREIYSARYANNSGQGRGNENLKLERMRRGNVNKGLGFRQTMPAHVALA